MQADTSLVWTFDPHIPQPNSTQFKLASQVGTDGYGIPQVRGYGAMIWTYQVMHPDIWYYVLNLWRTLQTSGSAWGYTKIQWPDPQSGMTTQATCRFEPPMMQDRTQAVMRGVMYTFSHLGFDDASATGFWLPPSVQGF